MGGVRGRRGEPERRLNAGRRVLSVAADGGYACGGLSDESIPVWLIIGSYVGCIIYV